jgi:indole-3-glycerol phosphate synthase
MSTDHLSRILARKARECERRRRHRGLFDPARCADGGEDRGPAVLAALRRTAGPRVIAEVKFRSPSAGELRAWRPGEGLAIARGYVGGGASAISVLCDRAGFGGSVLEARRVARAVGVPVLFKEFVLEPLQIDLARAAGASMVLLLVRALDGATLRSLVDRCRERGLEPVVEAADEAEVERALETSARVIGVNARDLASFHVDASLAGRAIQKIPRGRVAVYMSGVSSREELTRVAGGRADAVLIGSGLMRAADPGRRLAELLA